MNGTVTALAGACATSGVDPDLFFSDDPQDEAKAKAICAVCPSAVRARCLDTAMETSAVGVWAGLNDSERLVIQITARPAGRYCRKGLHLLEGDNLGDRGRCVTCRHDYDRDTRPSFGRPRTGRDENGRFAAAAVLEAAS